MFVIPLGPFQLNGPLLLHLLFGVAGYVAASLLAARGDDRERIRSALFAGYALWLAVWKLSFVLIDAPGAFAHPASLLYFDGGKPGAAAATAAALACLAIRSRASLRLMGRTLSAATVFVFGGAAAKQMAYAALGRPEFDALLLAAGAIGLALWAALRAVWSRSAGRPRAMLAAQSAIWVGAAALLLGAAAEGAKSFEARRSASVDGVGLSVGMIAPDPGWVRADGTAESLDAYGGKVVLLNFWATWCPPCRAEMPYLERLEERYRDEGLAVVALNLTRTESGPEAAQRFARDRALQLPLALDPQGEAMRAYAVRAYPTTYVIGADGRIAGAYEGAMHLRAMEEAIRPALEAMRASEVSSRQEEE